MAPFGSRLDVRVSDLWTLYMDAVGKISGWTGVHGSEYEGQIPRLQWYVGLWSGLALIFPFLAALLLGLGKGTGPSVHRPVGQVLSPALRCPMNGLR